MKLISKMKEKDNLPIILFVVVLINYLPLFINNAFFKDSKPVSIISMIGCFGVEFILLIVNYIGNKKDISVRNIKKDLIVLVCITLVMIGVQIKNWIQDNFFIMDIFNIGCIFINILLFYIII